MKFGPYPAVVHDWHDGDTCHVDLDLGFGLKLALSCRIFGINAPELSTATGPASREYARLLCPTSTAVSITSHGWDKYGGRFDGEITLPDGSDFATQMLAADEAIRLP